MNNPKWVVKDVKAKTDYTLLLTFTNGEKRLYNVKPLLTKPIYQKLNNLTFFLTAKILGPTVAWSDEIDIAPEYLYDNSEKANN